MNKTLLTLALGGLMLSSASAALIVYEGFAPPPTGPYTVGNIAGQNPGNSATSTGWTGAWKGETGIAVQNTALSYTGLETTTTGGLFVPFNNSGRWAMRQLATGYSNTSSGTLYISFLVQDVTQGGGAANSEWNFELHNAGTGTRVWNNTQTLRVGMLGTVGDITMRTFGNGQGGTGTADASPVNLGASTTNVELFVVKIELSATAGQDTITIWRNPTNLSLESANTAAGSLTGKTLRFDNIALSEYRNDAGGVFFDEIRMGTTWDSVTPIPEPSTYAALFGLLALGFVAWRRRR